MHFVGPDLEDLKSQVPSSIVTIFYGEKDLASITALMPVFNIAVVPFAYDYSSPVKVFMYGAAKLLMLVPETENLQSAFSKSEVMFIKNADPVDIAATLDLIAENPCVVQEYGEEVYRNVKNNFAWERIYEGVSSKINEFALSGKYESVDVAWKS
jgi:hypothetical protein